MLQGGCSSSRLGQERFGGEIFFFFRDGLILGIETGKLLGIQGGGAAQTTQQSRGLKGSLNLCVQKGQSANATERSKGSGSFPDDPSPPPPAPGMSQAGPEQGNTSLQGWVTAALPHSHLNSAAQRAKKKNATDSVQSEQKIEIKLI